MKQNKINAILKIRPNLLMTLEVLRYLLLIFNALEVYFWDFNLKLNFLIIQTFGRKKIVEGLPIKHFCFNSPQPLVQFSLIKFNRYALQG